MAHASYPGGRGPRVPESVWARFVKAWRRSPAGFFLSHAHCSEELGTLRLRGARIERRGKRLMLRINAVVIESGESITLEVETRDE